MSEESQVAPTVSEESAPQGNFLGGEIHIVADPVTGGISVNAPPNLVIAFGLMEMAKVLLAQRQQEAMRKAPPPAIIRGDSAMVDKIAKLVKPS